MPARKQNPATPLEKEISVADVATFSHQKGDVQMITISRDKLEAIISTGSSLSSNFFTLMVGTVLTIIIALKSGGVDEAWKDLFWVSFWFSVVLAAFFGLLTTKQEIDKLRLRKELRNLPSTTLKK